MILPVDSLNKVLFEPQLKIKSFWKSITITTPKRKIIDPHHHWELNYKDYSEKRLLNVFEQRDFHLKNKMSYLRWRYFHFNKIS